MWGIVLVALIVILTVAVVALPLLSMNAFYARVFAGENLVAIAQGLSKIKPQVVANIASASNKPSDDSWVQRQSLVTPCGLGIVYTIEQQRDVFLHHISLSRNGGAVAHAAAKNLTPFILSTLGIPSLGKSDLSLPPSKSGIQHISFSLTAEQQHQYNTMGVTVPPSTQEAEEYWKKSLQSVRG
jgi:hypothetical protein